MLGSWDGGAAGGDGRAALGLSCGSCDAGLGLGTLPGAVGLGWGAAESHGHAQPGLGLAGLWDWSGGEQSGLCRWVWQGWGPGAGCWHPAGRVPGGSQRSGWGNPAFRSPGGPTGLPLVRGRAVLVSACPCAGTVGPALFCPRSPSGCTFWGKRPWSRTRKILWQLGMVLGAPMVISLVAGIAVPVMTIGIPIYMGRKVLEGGPGVPMVPLPAEPGSPWLEPGQTPSAHCCPQRVLVPPLTPHSPSLQGPSLLLTPAPSAGEVMLGGGRGG